MSIEYRVVIPSKTPANLHLCVAQIVLHEPTFDTRNIIVVDDGLNGSCPEWVTRIEGIKPFNFARNINLGMRRALETGAECVVLLNDDAMLIAREGFRRLVKVAIKNNAVVSSAIQGAACNPQQRIENMLDDYVQRQPMLAFVAVAIPRRVIEKIGWLDEIFDHDGYGSEDNDYAVRCHKAGIDLAVSNWCVVDHTGRLARSTYRTDPSWKDRMGVNQKRLKEKWAGDPAFGA